MGIPKKIHYCWYGGKRKPLSVRKCIQSWKKYCPDWEIIEWNEKNTNFEGLDYAKEALKAKKYSFVSDVIRLKAVYENGGIYLDTDVELIKPLDDLLELEGFFALEESEKGVYRVATGLGFGGVFGSRELLPLLWDYQNSHFIKKDGSYDLGACPLRNTNVLSNYGFENKNEIQMLGDFVVFPTEYFAPLCWWNKEITITENTYSIHHYDSSWEPWKRRVRRKLEKVFGVGRVEKVWSMIRRFI